MTVPGGPAALEVGHLSVAFGRNTVVRDLSFRVEQGDCLAIIGPNGSGKTVLFKALIGALAYEGRIAWAPGTTIGYVPQKLDIERDLPITGRDFLRAKAAVSRAAPEEIVRVLGLVGLSPALAAQPIGTLSGGQFQRLLLAFALMGRPSVLLFDEPTAGVDEPMAVSAALLSTLVGLSLAPLVHLEAGPLIIAVAAGLFFGSLLVRQGAQRGPAVPAE